jgi:hypothetical protein
MKRKGTRPNAVGRRRRPYSGGHSVRPARGAQVPPFVLLRYFEGFSYCELTRSAGYGGDRLSPVGRGSLSHDQLLDTIVEELIELIRAAIDNGEPRLAWNQEKREPHLSRK